MNVLMIVRQNLYSSPGGDTTQIEMTAKYLRQLGVNVQIELSNAVNNVNNFDLVHFFNIIRPDDILPNIPKKVPYVVSTIFVDYSEYDKKIRSGGLSTIFKLISPGRIEYIKAIARWVFNGDKIKSRYYLFRGHKSSIKKISRGASMFLPNSNNEYNRFRGYIGRDVAYHKIVNAIDVDNFNENVKPNEDYRDHVICVGRIEGLKNQLNLIKAIKDTNLKLTIIGKAASNHHAYYNSCRELAKTSPNIKFIEHSSAKDLSSIYMAAKVHVLPSWFETTGLSSLEAGSMNCNLVITKKGDTQEYFQDMAYYCEPDNIDSIKNAVLKAHAEPVNQKLQRYIIENYNWKNTAEQTLSAYKEVLNIK